MSPKITPLPKQHPTLNKPHKVTGGRGGWGKDPPFIVSYHAYGLFMSVESTQLHHPISHFLSAHHSTSTHDKGCGLAWRVTSERDSALGKGTVRVRTSSTGVASKTETAAGPSSHALASPLRGWSLVPLACLQVGTPRSVHTPVCRCEMAGTNSCSPRCGGIAAGPEPRF